MVFQKKISFQSQEIQTNPNPLLNGVKLRCRCLIKKGIASNSRFMVWQEARRSIILLRMLSSASFDHFLFVFQNRKKTFCFLRIKKQNICVASFLIFGARASSSTLSLIQFVETIIKCFLNKHFVEIIYIAIKVLLLSISAELFKSSEVFLVNILPKTFPIVYIQLISIL
jgi:hypothetical protein